MGKLAYSRRVRLKTVGAFDAKTHFNGLLKRVSEGETIQITVRGVPVAMLVPSNDRNKINPRQLVREIRELRNGASLGKSTIRDLIDEGRSVGTPRKVAFVR